MSTTPTTPIVVAVAPSTLLKDKNHHPRDDRIVFYEEPHIYEIDGSSKGYTSVTTLNATCFSHFDQAGMIAKIVSGVKMRDPEYAYYGKTAEEIADLWKKNGQAAAEAGTAMHNNIEKYYNGIPLHDESSVEYQYFLKFAADYPHLEAYRTEWLIFNEDIKLAGAIDMVFFNKETGKKEIYDWKRVKEIKYDAYKKTDVGLYPFLATVPDTNFWHYALQLNTYKKMLGDKYDIEIDKMFLVVIHPDNRMYLRLEVPDMQAEIGELFEVRRKQLV